MNSNVSIVDDLTRTRKGDDDAFTRLVEPLRRELHAHCDHMLGSTHDSHDALQDALLRVWRGLARFEGRASLRPWLYTVATRTCLDFVELALAFVAACQHLPGNQRAALLLFEVLEFTDAEIAEMMDTSTTSVNSALARRPVAQRVPKGTQQPTLRTLDNTRLREVVSGFAEALARGDTDAMVRLPTEGAAWSMPPLPHWYEGLTLVTEKAVPLGSCGNWRHRSTTANGQPAVTLYLRRVEGEPFHAWEITVLTVRGDRIAELTTFMGPEHFPVFGLPAVNVA
ncbi:sigma factor [Actinophytocola sp.]|uniref:sigma factor n=1 Tax=Actinophytocola sp. TaxID=1872138 RepID=UPI002ED0E364